MCTGWGCVLMFANPMLGCVNSDGGFHCPRCLHPADACGIVYALDICSSDDPVSVCAVCGVDTLERDDLREWLSRPIGWQSVAHSDVVLCPTCFGEVCDPRCEDDHEIVTLGDALRWTESDRRCAMCRDLLFW